MKIKDTNKALTKIRKKKIRNEASLTKERGSKGEEKGRKGGRGGEEEGEGELHSASQRARNPLVGWNLPILFCYLHRPPLVELAMEAV